MNEPSEIIAGLDALLAPRYTILQELGRGATAVVYLAEDRKHRRKVAIKLLRVELAQALGPDRFLREIRISAALGHPNIVPVHDSGQAGGTLYYVMPVVEGESLRARLEREGALPLAEIVGITQQVAAALDHAHAQQIVHRDLKPENILLAEGRALVSDFGVARATAESAGTPGLTEPGLAVGTPHYMSPEQAAADPRIDARSDQYGLGVVVYEMLTGEKPFQGASPRAVLARKLSDNVPPIRTVRESIPPAVEDVVMRALARMPGDRYASAGEFAAALEKASTKPGADRLRRRRMRLRVAVPVGGIIVALGTALFAAPEDSVTHTVAVLPLENRSPDENQAYIVAGLTDGLSSDLGRFSDLHLTSRTSAEHYAGGGMTIRDIATALRVGAVVEGSATVIGDSIRVGLRLVHGRTDRQLWTADFGGGIGDIPRLQREAAIAIAEALGVDAEAASEARSIRTRPVHPEAYRLTLAGDHQQMQASSGLLALDLYQRAIAIDSTFAPAHAGLAITYTQLGNWWGTLPPDSAYPLAREAALRAIRLDSMNAEGHTALANVLRLYDWDWAAAEEHFRRGMTLNPSKLYARIEYANFLSSIGRYREAIDLGRTTLNVAPTAAIAYNELAFALDLDGKDEEALRYYHASLDLDSTFEQTRAGLALFFSRRGVVDSTLTHLTAVSQIVERSTPANIALMAGAYAAIGRFDDARRLARLIDRHEASGFVPPSSRGYLHACLGEVREALPWFERAFEERDPNLIWLSDSGDPCYRKLMGERRFQAVIRKMNFPRTDA